jgi:hypothetical protein
MDAPTPEGEENCVSQNGFERSPNDVTPKEEVAYQFHPNYLGQGNVIQMCANCRFFCPANPPNEIGACSEVDGGIRSQDWCALWQAADHLERRDRNGNWHGGRPRVE